MKYKYSFGAALRVAFPDIVGSTDITMFASVRFVISHPSYVRINRLRPLFRGLHHRIMHAKNLNRYFAYA